DKLRQLGTQIRPLMQQVQAADDQKQIWEEFCMRLEFGEVTTAQLYDEKLSELRNLPYRGASLDTVQTAANEIARLLSNQKARFDLLAKKARATLKALK